MTAPRDRQLGLARAQAKFEELLAGWNSDEQPVDINDLAHLAIYTKDPL